MQSLYIGNLNPATTPEELRTLFQTYGQVGYVNIIKDRDSEQSRGFAFIEMTNDADAERAIKAKWQHLARTHSHRELCPAQARTQWRLPPPRPATLNLSP